MAARRMFASVGLCAFGVILGGLVFRIDAQGTPQPPSGQTKVDAKVGDPGDRTADRIAIRDAMKQFLAAFEKGDAAAAAAHMTTGAELMAPDGTTVHGRDAIQKAYAEHFAKYPKHQVRVEPESLRFTSRDTALEEGHMTVTRGKESPGIYRYVVLYVRENGAWLMAVVRNDESAQASLLDLDWLIGTWQSKGSNGEVRTTYEWMGNKAFIRSQFTIQTKGVAVTGTQMIGLDPATGTLRVWTFEADGSIGEGTATRDGDKWLFASSATLADGRTMTATNVLSPIDHDTFTWQPLDLTIDGEAIGNMPPIKVARMKSP
ncbi:MAG: SgcJ/EcaC family oxidoreductase [Gemmataceae bacterium]